MQKPDASPYGTSAAASASLAPSTVRRRVFGLDFAGSSGGIAMPIIAGFILQLSGTHTAVLQFCAGCAALYIPGTLPIPFEKPVAERAS